jgi:hypothetical protein
MKLWSAAAATLASVLLSPQVHASTVLTFDEFAESGTGLRTVTRSGTLDYRGFVFQSVQPNDGFKSWRTNDAQNADPGGATLVHNWANALMTVSKADGSLFDLISMDVQIYSIQELKLLAYFNSPSVMARKKPSRLLLTL